MATQFRLRLCAGVTSRHMPHMGRESYFKCPTALSAFECPTALSGGSFGRDSIQTPIPIRAGLHPVPEAYECSTALSGISFGRDSIQTPILIRAGLHPVPDTLPGRRFTPRSGMQPVASLRAWGSQAPRL